MKFISFLRYFRNLQEKIREYVLLRNPLREHNIRNRQQQLLQNEYSPDASRLIIYFAPGYDFVNGGILSINSIYSETKKLADIHASKVIMCTLPGTPLLLRYTKFANTNYLFTFSNVLRYFRNVQSIMLHIPELSVSNFVKNISREDYSLLSQIHHVSINILLQNIELLPTREAVEELKQLGKLTCTTAHEAYSTLETAEWLGCPVHKLSTSGSPNQYLRTAYSNKENLMIISPDSHDLKSVVLSKIAKRFPQLRLQVIKNLTYDEYKRIISKAKWAITFGEGLDGYFGEPIFSGAISFAVYNTKFFTQDFKELQTVYSDYDTLIQKICIDIDKLDNETNYKKYQNQQHAILSKHYNFDEYISNIKSFYENHYPGNR